MNQENVLYFIDYIRRLINDIPRTIDAASLDDLEDIVARSESALIHVVRVEHWLGRDKNGMVTLFQQLLSALRCRLESTQRQMVASGYVAPREGKLNFMISVNVFR